MRSKYPERSIRFNTFLNSLNMKNIAAGKKLGVRATVISQLRNSHMTITLDYATRICAAFPELNFLWLLRGEGEMIITTRQEIDMVEEFLPVYEKSRSRTLKELEDDLDRHENMFEEMARQMREMKNEIEKLKS